MGAKHPRGANRAGEAKGGLSLTLDEFFAEFAAPDGADVFTRRELQSYGRGMSQQAASKKIRDGIEGGVIEYAGKEFRPNVFGGQHTVPVYRWIGEHGDA